jgi:hypothetical protein
VTSNSAYLEVTLGSLVVLATQDPYGCDLVVDVSNVCRDGALDGEPTPSLARLGAALSAWVRHARTPRPRVMLIADKSFLSPGSVEHRLSAVDQVTAEQWVRDDVLRLHPVADGPILQAAAAAGVPVLSRDRYNDHRLDHPWIDNSTDRFFAADRQPDGRIVVEARAMGAPTPFTRSQKMEYGESQGRRLVRGDRLSSVTASLWSCPTPDCVLAGEFPDLPVLNRGKVSCPVCGARATVSRPRPVALQLRIRRRGEERNRFTVVPGTVRLSGLPREGCVAVPEVTEATGPFAELVIASVNPAATGSESLGLTVTALRPDVPIAVERRLANRSYGDPEPVPVGKRVELGLRDRVHVGRDVQLERCGRLFPTTTDYYVGEDTADAVEAKDALA